MSPQTAWFEALAHNAALKHCTVEELETLCYELAALPLALFKDDGLMRTVQKLRWPGISVKNGE